MSGIQKIIMAMQVGILRRPPSLPLKFLPRLAYHRRNDRIAICEFCRYQNLVGGLMTPKTVGRPHPGSLCGRTALLNTEFDASMTASLRFGRSTVGPFARWLRLLRPRRLELPRISDTSAFWFATATTACDHF
jgi:hypothetical protein